MSIFVRKNTLFQLSNVKREIDLVLKERPYTAGEKPFTDTFSMVVTKLTLRLACGGDKPFMETCP